MPVYTSQQYCEMIIMYGECNRNAHAAARLYAERYPGDHVPTTATITRVVKRLRETGSVMSRPRPGRPSNSGSVPPVDVVAFSLAHPHYSSSEIGAHCGLGKTRVLQILQKHQVHPYHVFHHQALYEGDPRRRLDWCNFVLNKLDEDVLFLHRILFTDEAKFQRDGIVNRRNTHHWAIDNPYCTHPTRNQVQWSVNVWCGVWGDTLIGPIFYDGTLNGQRYLDILQGPVMDWLEEAPLQSRRVMWFQHDGAPPHRTRAVQTWLNATFPRRVMGVGGHVEWPPRSPDLTPLDFFLWGYLKTEVYATPNNSQQHLINKIRDATAALQRGPFTSVRANLLKRIQTCIVADGGAFEHALH